MGEATEQFVSQIYAFERAEDEVGVTLHPVFDTHLYTESWANAFWSSLYAYDERATIWADATVLIMFSGSYWLDKDAEVFYPPLNSSSSYNGLEPLGKNNSVACWLM